jgi:shikimate dehydrogenase
MPTTDTLNRDTTLCISLAARPSNIGTRFHNFLYDELGLNFVWLAELARPPLRTGGGH